MAGGKSSPIPKPDPDCFLQTKIAEVRDLLSKGYQRKASFDLKLQSHEKCDNRNVDYISSNIWKWSFGIPGFQLMDYFSYHFHYFLSFSLFLIIL